MIVMIVLVAVYGLAQCTLLGSWVRSVRWRTLVVAVFAGAYAAAAVSVGVQWAWTRAFAVVSGVPLSTVVTVASYTVDPLVEELVKVAPVLVVWRLVAAVRHTWGYTDLVLVAAGVGTGFGITENLLRYGGASNRVLLGGVCGDWTLPGGLFGALTVPGPVTAVGQWVPAGVQVSSLLSSNPTDAIDVHLVWSAIAGLGLALVLRGAPGRLPGRWVGVVLIGFAAADHMANNTIGQGGLVEAAGSPLGWLRHLIWAYPLAVLGVAAVLDRRTLDTGRQVDGSVLLGAGSGPEAGVLARLALARPRVSAQVVWSFVLARRAYWTALSTGSGPPGTTHEVAGKIAGEMVGGMRQWAGVLRAAAGPAGERVWAQVAADRTVARKQARAERSRVAVGVWVLLLAGPFGYFVVGGVPAWSGVQAWLSVSPGFWVLLGLAVLGIGWTAWRLRGAVLAWPRVRNLAAADVPAGVVLSVGTQVATLGIGAACVYLAARGVGGDTAIVSNFHILDAIGRVLLIGGIALMLLAVAADPPLALVVLAGGGSTWVWTGITAATADALITGTAIATTGAGIHYMTGDSSGSGRTGDGEGAADETAADSGGQRPFRQPQPGSGKDRASDAPSWVKNDPAGRPYANESGRAFAKRMMDKKYGADGWSDTGPRSEYNQIKKYGDRGFK